MFTLSFFCKDTCLLRTIFVEDFSGRSKQVLLYKASFILSGAIAHYEWTFRHLQTNIHDSAMKIHKFQ